MEPGREGSAGLWTTKPAHAGYPGSLAIPGEATAAETQSRGGGRSQLQRMSVRQALPEPKTKQMSMMDMPDELVWRTFKAVALSGRDAGDGFGCFSPWRRPRDSVEQLAACAEPASFSVEQLVALDLLGLHESEATAKLSPAEAAAKFSSSRQLLHVVLRFNEQHRLPPYSALPEFVLAAPRAAQLSLTNSRFRSRTHHIGSLDTRRLIKRVRAHCRGM
jgi:hypothetical protein